MHVNAVGRTKRQQEKIDAWLDGQGSLWHGDIPGINTYDIRIWTFHLRRLAKWYLRISIV